MGSVSSLLFSHSKTYKKTINPLSKLKSHFKVRNSNVCHKIQTIFTIFHQTTIRYSNCVFGQVGKGHGMAKAKT